MMKLKEKCINILEGMNNGHIKLSPKERISYDDIPKRYKLIDSASLPQERLQMADAFLDSTSRKCRNIAEVENLIATIIKNEVTGYTLAPWSKPQCYILEDVEKYLKVCGMGDMDEECIISRIAAKTVTTIYCDINFYKDNTGKLSVYGSIDIDSIMQKLTIVKNNCKFVSDKIINMIEYFVANILTADVSAYDITISDIEEEPDLQNPIIVMSNNIGSVMSLLALMLGGDELLEDIAGLLPDSSEPSSAPEESPATNDTSSSPEETDNTSEENIVEGTAIILPDSSSTILSGPVESVKAALTESNDRFNNCNEEVSKDIAKSFDAIIGKINTKRDGVISLGELNNIMKVEFDHQLSVITSTFQKLMMRNPDFFGTIRRNLDGFSNILNTHRVKLISDISNYSNADMVLAGVPIENVTVEELCQAKSNAISFLNDFAKTLFEALTVGIIPTEKSKKTPQNNTKDKSSKQEEHAGQHGKNNGPIGEVRNQQPVEKDVVITQQPYYPRITDEVICNHIIIPPYVTVVDQSQENALICALKVIATIAEQRDTAMSTQINSVFYITDYKDAMNFVAKRCINTMPDGSYNTFVDQINAAEFEVINGSITMYFREFRPASGGFIAGWASIIMPAYTNNATIIPINGSEEAVISVNFGAVTKINNDGGDEVVTNPEVTTKSKPKLHIKKGGVGKVRLSKQDQLILQRMAKKQRRIDLKAESRAKNQNNQQHNKRRKNKNKKSFKQVNNG